MDQVYDDIRPLVEQDMVVRTAGKSLAVSISVPPLDTEDSFDEQASDAEQGMQAALRLKRWFHCQHSTLREIARKLSDR